jgi:raffinose/stachyose/melibiose transport system substrate-binding protein
MAVTRRAVLGGAAAALALAGKSRPATSETLEYKGELTIVAVVRTPPDQAFAALVKSFEVAHPGITIRELDYPSESYVSLFTAQQTAGESADILILNGQDLRRYATNDTLLALDTAAAHLDRFRPGALATCQIGGKTWGLPYSDISGFPVFANRKVLDKVGMAMPKTYSDFLELRDKLKGSGIKVFTHPGKDLYLWPVWFFTTFAQTSGNSSLRRTAEILSGKGKFSDDDVVKGLSLIFQFGQDGLLTQEIFSMDTPQALADFSAGRAAFWMHHESLISEIAADKPPELQLDVMLMPKLVDTAVSQYPGGPTAIAGMNAKSEFARQAAAMAFLDWITTDEADRAVVQFNNGTVPVNIGVKAFGGPIVDKMVQFLPNLVTYLDWNWPPEVTRAFQEGIQSGVAGQSSANDVASSAQDALDRLVDDGYKLEQ